MITTKKIKNFDIIPPKKGAFTIDTEDDFPKMHTLTIASGKRGGGKSVAVANLLKKAKDKGYLQKVWLITPTYNSNKSIWDVANILEEDVFEPTVNVLKDICKKIEAEKLEWDEFLEKKKKYKEFLKDNDKSVMNINPYKLMDYYDLGFLDKGEPPKWKYDQEVPPRLAVCLDDVLGTDLLAKRSAGLLNFCIKHRHHSCIGISVYILTQSYCSQGGINRAIRENNTALMLFKLNDDNQRKKIKEEADLECTNEEFEKMCEYAHSKPYNFLFMDFAPKDDKKRFRSGFDEYLIPDTLK